MNQANPYELGKKGEDEAAEYLRQRGYQILEQRYKTRVGELDIVCCLRDRTSVRVLVFVEVKARSPRSFGRPEQAITRTQMRRMYNAAQVFLHENPHPGVLCRFDVVAVYLVNGRLEVEHFEEAFGVTELMDMD